MVVLKDTSVQLGAIRFDRDLRAIIAYLSSQTIFGDIRDKFVRLQQISLLLNLDHVSASSHRMAIPHTNSLFRKKMWMAFTAVRAYHGL